jgi:NAD(P)-dependent dehydrogenase (short-subunit alcohol dehydrogenase family)
MTGDLFPARLTGEVIKPRTTADIPPQAGRLAVVTGAASGLGYETALGLAQKCVDVIIAGPDEIAGREALRKIRPLAPEALIRFEPLDLANLESVAAFARRLIAENHALDLLINGAGIMASPKRRASTDGFELQLATNYLGHFALTGLLLPLLRRSKSPRVVQVSSLVHRYGKIHFDDLQSERKYKPWGAYFQSKLAMLTFAFELQRRSDAYRWGLLSTAVHPGYTQTELVSNNLGAGSLIARLSQSFGGALSHSAAEGAQPSIFAATSDNAKPGGFYGPGGFLEFTGPPVAAFTAAQARDEDVARKLWEVSEKLTGVTFPTS